MDASKNTEKGKTAERTGDSRGRSRNLPVAVEAVVCMGYPPDLVHSIYQQLLSTHAQDSLTASHPPRMSGAAALTGNTLPSRDVSAATLLVAVDDAIRHGSSTGRSSDVRIGSGIATSSESSFGLALQRPWNEDMLLESGEVQMDASEDNVPSTSQPQNLGHGQHQSFSQAVVDPSQPSTVSQTSVNASQSYINDQSSNAESAALLTETPSTSTPTGAEGSETASSLNTSIHSIARPAESSDNGSATSASTVATHASTGPSYPNASLVSVAKNSTGTHQVVSRVSSSTAAARDRSSERGEGNAVPTEEEARERRRELLTRLRALREENR
ncbi:hypothetical protein ACOMHN_063597 [Nucella lapillus]